MYIQYVRELAGEEGLVEPVLTPRFVPTCTMELMEGLAALQRKYNVRLMTLMSHRRLPLLRYESLTCEYVWGDIGNTGASAVSRIRELERSQVGQTPAP